MTAVRFMRMLVFVALAVSMVSPAIVLGDPCLSVYPTSPATYHYDVNEYYTVTYGHPLYDPMYDRGGEVLIDLNTHEIALDIYQIPNLTGFQVSFGGNEGYFFIGSSFDIVIEGFENRQAIYENVILVFDPDPWTCIPTVTVDGEPLTGKYYPVGDLVVSSPTPEGKSYSDTIVKHVTWGGCYGLRMWAFADENHNGVRDGGECFTAFSHDSVVPVQNKTWGAIKSLYK